MLKYAREAFALARERGMFVVFDADALWMLSEDVKILQGYRRAVITPNVAEFARLLDKLGIDGSVAEEQKAGLVSRALGGVTVLRKGPTDAIAIDNTSNEADMEASKVSEDSERESTTEAVVVDVEGGMRRCSGQGDVLSGVVGTILAWGKCYELGYFG
jgi:ATP-dependent NAD(P)H-hydrate dehydratase